MSLVASHWELTVQLVDEGGNSTTRRFQFRATDDAGDMSALLTVGGEMLADLAAVTDAVIKKASYNKVMVENAFALPDEGEIEEHALITAPIDGEPLKSASIDIPAPKDTIFVGAPGDGASFNQVDFADTALLDYLSDFTGGSSAFLVSDGEAIIQNNLRGKRTHSRSTGG